MPGPSPSPGADPAYVALLRRIGATDPDAVRAHIDRLIAAHTTPELLAMDDVEFWAHARRTIRCYLEETMT